jgi:hypothetical protein
MSLWWLSFCDDTKTGPDAFLGVSIVEAPNEPLAVVISSYLGINPGGEVLAAKVPSELEHRYAPHMDRVLSREEVYSLFDDAKTLGELEDGCK